MRVSTVSEHRIEGTTNELAKILGVEYAEATGFIKTLVALNVASNIGSRPAAGGKGKPSIVYSVPASFGLELQEEAKAA